MFWGKPILAVVQDRLPQAGGYGDMAKSFQPGLYRRMLKHGQMV